MSDLIVGSWAPQKQIKFRLEMSESWKNEEALVYLQRTNLTSFRVCFIDI